MKGRLSTLAGGLLILAGTPALSFATQGHGDPEGLLVHQMSHLFFICSMGLLVYWLRVRHLVGQKGWKYIQYAALFFMIWTVDAFLAHLFDEQYAWIQVTRADRWHLSIDAAHPALAVIYYIIKLDHLWCVPAMIFLYLGLKTLCESPQQDPDKIQEEET